LFQEITKAPVIIAINAIQKVPIVVNDKIEIREVVNLNYEIDHRFMDGARAIVFNKIVYFLFNKRLKDFLMNLKSI
jgi:pyruvate/2-oxoglutarate dehydrogenase complex dihydrolipoamide acyltransferase (E2) component